MFCINRILLGGALETLKENTESSFGVSDEKDYSVYLKPSSSPHRKPSFIVQRMGDKHLPSFAIRAPHLGSALPLFKLTGKSDFYSIRLPLLKSGFRRISPAVQKTSCNLFWGRSLPFRSVKSTKEGADKSASPLTLPMPTSESQREFFSSLYFENSLQKFNHFPRSVGQLGCKKGMARNLRRADDRWCEVRNQASSANHTYLLDSRGKRKRGTQIDESTEYTDFSPPTWFYPEEKDLLETVFRQASPSEYFIWKPSRGSCGKGIAISRGGARHASTWEKIMSKIDSRLVCEPNSQACSPLSRAFQSYVVQKYILNPFLVQGRKMDLRLYVGVTSYNPLRVYLHEEGLMRLAAHVYKGAHPMLPLSLLPGNSIFDEEEDATNFSQGDCFRHLTNFSIGRKIAKAPPVRQSSSETPPLRLKWALSELWDLIDSTDKSPHSHFDSSVSEFKKPSQKVKEDIGRVIVRTLMAARPILLSTMSRIDKKTLKGDYFELYGFDIMLDSNLKPWLIEVNTYPSLASSSVEDFVTKSNVIADLFNMAMIEPFERNISDLNNASTSGPLIVEPPSASALQFIHTLREQRAQTIHSLVNNNLGISREEQRENIESLLKDESHYSRGFKRIFPPLNTKSYPSDHLIHQREMDIFERMDYLTDLDKIALESSP